MHEGTPTQREIALQARLEGLQAVSSGLAGASTPEDVIEVIVTRGSSVLGGRSGSLCLLLDDGGTFELVREIGYRRETAEAWRRFPLAAPLPAGDALRKREIVTMTSIADRDAKYPMFRDTPTVGSAFAVVPLVLADGRPIGVFTVGFPDERDFAKEDLEFLRSLGDLCAQAIDRARLFADLMRVAATLQASLLPPTLPQPHGVELGAAYVAGAGAEVGGDFYDAFAIDAERWILTIGDVRGKGIEAAELTALARHTIRSASVTNSSPVAILEHLNAMLLRSQAIDDPEPRFCTVALALLEPAGGTVRLTVCCAGHPLPLLWSKGEVTEIGLPGTVLGVVSDVELHEHEVVLATGDIVVLFTDGVSERRDHLTFFDTSGLASTIGAVGSESAAATADAVERAVRAFSPDAMADDMAVLIVKALGT
jgi:serine phosphatase RsbU (regulator of sigma subunit)